MTEPELTPERLMARVDEITAQQIVDEERRESREWHRVTVNAKIAEAGERNAESALSYAVIKVNEQALRKQVMEGQRFSREEDWLKSVDVLHGHITFCEDVTQEGVLTLTQHLRRMDRMMPEEEFTLELNSPGGEVVASLHLFDNLVALKRKHRLTVVVRGEACSMAGVLLQAGTHRVIGKHAHIMLHRASFGAAGSADQVEDAVEQTKMFESAIYSILAERSGKSVAAWKTILGKRKDVWFSAADAIKHGLADEIG